MIYTNSTCGQYRCPMGFSTGVSMPCIGRECAGWREKDYQFAKTVDVRNDKEVIGYCGLAGPILWDHAVKKARHAS